MNTINNCIRCKLYDPNGFDVDTHKFISRATTKIYCGPCYFNDIEYRTVWIEKKPFVLELDLEDVD